MAKKTPGIYIAIRGDVSAFETDLNHARQIAKAQGEAIAKSIGNAVSKADLTGGITKLTRELKTAQAALSAGAFKTQVSGLEDIAKAAGVSSKQLEGLTNSMLKSQAAATANRAFEYLQKNAGLSTIQLAKLRAQLGDTSGALSTLWSGAKAAAVPVIAVGAAAIYAGKACFDASLQMDRLVKSYTSIEGSTAGAISKLDYIYEVSAKLGLEFQSTAESAKGFFAAGKGTTLQKDLNNIFEGVAQAGTALSLTTDQMDGVFLALGQMISKGKVQAEELRGQLGERLPGSFNLAAKAMGVTTAQLDDMLKKGQVTAEDMLPKLAAVLKEEFGPAAEQAAQGAQGAVNRLSTEWNLFKATVMDNKGIIAAINAITEALKRDQALIDAARREAAIKSLATDGVIKRGEKQVTDVDMASGAVTVQKVKFYTEEQIQARIGLEKAWEAHNKISLQLQEEETKIISDGSAAVKEYLKNTLESKRAALKEDYHNTLEALDKQVAVYKKQGQDVSGLEKERVKVTAEYRRQLEALNKKGASSAEAAANRAATALAAYDAELAKLMKSSRDVEQVKIEEKLRKIAKDAKLPAEALEELRHAMEQETDFKWMQGILSYADPAAAAIAKVDREYQGFLRDVQSLKKEDPEKYARLMAKAEAEHEKAIRKANRTSKEQNDHTQEKLAFYKELEELTGQYGLSLKYQNDLLNEQVELWRDADIPEEYINKMRELRELQMSRDWVDGAKRGLLEYRASASDTAKGVEESFKGLFDGMDSGWKSAWQQMIETGKVSLSSFRSLFASFLADLLHIAITRPITVQIAGVVSGMLGTGGVAHAAGGAGGSGGAGGLLGNIPFSSLLPDSITGGVSGLLGATLPGTTAVLTTPGAYTAGEILLMQGGGATAGTVGGQAALVSSGLSLGSALTYGGFGSLGYSLLGGALGLPQGKYSGLTAGVGGALGAWGGSALGSAAGIAAGSTLGSVVPVIGTALGAVAGGLIGSMFGKTKTHPTVYTNVPEASLVGTDWAEAFKQGAWGHRMSAGEIDSFFDEIGGYANNTAQTLLSFAQSLPEAYAAGVTENLKKQTVGMGRGTTAGRGWVGNRGPSAWDLQFYDDEHAERTYRTTQQDIARVMLQGLAKSMEAAGTSIRDIFPHLNLRASNADLSESDEWTNAVAGLTAIQGIQEAIKGIDGAQMTQAEQQAQAFVEQLEALSSAVASYGVDKGYADKLVEEYRAAYVDTYVKSLDEMLHPLSQVEQEAKGYREAIDGYVKALETMQASEAQLAKVRGYTQTAIDNIISSLESSLSPMAEIEQAQQNANAVIDQHIAALQQLGASEGEIARVEALRAEAVKQATEELLRSFEQNVAQRWAAIDGTSDEVGRAISQENELREAIQKFGEGSTQVAELLKLHAAETAKAAEEAAKAALEAAKSEYEALKSQMDALEQQRVQLQQQAIQEKISALNEQLSAAKTLKSTWEGLDKSLGQARYNLFAGAANIDAMSRLGTVQAEFRRLSGLAFGGDSEAAGQLAGVGSSLLDLVKQTAGTEDEYLDAFWAVNAQLKNAQDAAGAQVSSADKQLEVLQGQLDVQNAALAQLQGQSATLEEIEKQIAELRPLLEAAGQKAGIKAFASGGLALPGWALVGEKGPELVNFSQPGRVYTAADTAALFRSATPRAADAGSSEEVRALREEVYQLRRDMNILLSEVAKYGRRVSDLVELWDVEGVPTKVGA